MRLSGVAAVGLGLSACGGVSSLGGANPSDAESPTAIRLGGIGPLTGAAAIYGNATKYGAQVAVDQINATVGSTVLELNWQDDEHDPEKAINAYNMLRDWDMQILVGTTTTAPCVAVSAESNVDHIFQLTPSASSVDVIGGQTDEDGNVTIPRKDNVFQMCFTDPNQGKASAEYIAEQKLGSKIAVIYNNADVYSTGIYRKFALEAEGLGLEIVSTTTFTDDSATDFSVQVGDAKNAGADLLFLPIYYTPASLILAEAKKQNYNDVKFFGVDGLDGILTLEGFDTSLAEGVMLLTPFVASSPDERTQEFDRQYRRVSGSAEDPNQFAADSYDCVMTIYAALISAGLLTADGKIGGNVSTPEICDKLIKVFTDSSFMVNGLTGDNITWSASGEVSKEPKGMIIRNGVYEPMGSAVKAAG